jgi:hypothetical protein
LCEHCRSDYTSQHDFVVKQKIGSSNGNRWPESENDVSFFISCLVVAQFCYFVSKTLNLWVLPGTFIANPLQMRNKEQRNGSMDVDRCWAYIPFQDYLSVVLKTRPNKFALYASFTFVCIRACVTVNIYKNRVLIFIHEIFIISILRTTMASVSGVYRKQCL